MAKDDERTAVYREYEQGSISLEQVEEYEHQYQVAVQKQEAAFKKVMLAVNDIEKAFSHGNPWLMKFRAISIPEKLERTHLKEWLDHVWIVDFEQVEVILQESKWKGFFPEEWLNNGEEGCNGKKEGKDYDSAGCCAGGRTAKRKRTSAHGSVCAAVG